ncbi:MAG TPA: SDR family oxidoreductase [Pseudomonadales bacterium]|nr:SDR family oxidoreductase [Pseudomonadales bacterium]
MRGVEGQSFIVTGGSAGIGAACAARLLADGAMVTICGRSERRLHDAAEQLARGDSSVRARLHFEVADVTVEDDVARLVAQAVAQHGSLHGFVANAGGGGTLEPYHRRDIAEFVRVLNLNLLSTVLCVKHAAPALAAAGGGAFIAMSSLAGSLPHPYFGAYPIAKAGIEALVRNAADEYGAVNLRFNAVAPGFIDTEAMAVVPRDSPVFRSYVDNTPLGDIGHAEDVAALVRFLLGPEARWITGETIRIDGGNHLRRGPDYGSFVALGLPTDGR